MHLPHLILDLGLILGAAGVVSILFQRFRQPVVLGYIMAGLLLGPSISFLPTVTDVENIKIWAEIGVIFLLFGLGLEFSFKKLWRVGGASSITALVEIVGMLGLGYGLGKIFGWSNMDSIFLGGILSISSTTIIVRAFDELKMKHRKFVGLVFGVLIVEDLMAILLLVILTTVSIGQQVQGGDLVISVLKLAFFMAIWFVGGIFLLPSFLRKTKSLLGEETMLLVAIAMCFGMVIFAYSVGFSPALGAFVMGSLLAETREAERIEHLTRPVKDLFAAVFFVSVGMLIDPSLLVTHWKAVIVIVFVTIFGKTLTTVLGALLAGQSLRHSLQMGMSLAQIGEFSFIIATLGQSLNVTSDFLYPIAVGVSAVTTFTTPYLIRATDPLYQRLQPKIPAGVWTMLERYNSGAQSLSLSPEWKIILHQYLVRMVTNLPVILSIHFIVQKFGLPFIVETFPSISAVKWAGAFLTFFLTAPFLWALSFGPMQRDSIQGLWRNQSFRGPILAMEISRLVLGVAAVSIILWPLAGSAVAFLITLPILCVILIFSSKKLQAIYQWFEFRFISNLRSREDDQSFENRILAPWDAHIEKYIVPAESLVVGRTLAELSIREKFGLTIVMIRRGKLQYTPPRPEDHLYPFDELAVLGTDEQLQFFREYLQPEICDLGGDDGRDDIRLFRLSVDPDFLAKGAAIRDTQFREKTGALIVGVERGLERHLNPDADFELKIGDFIWVVGTDLTDS